MQNLNKTSQSDYNVNITYLKNIFFIQFDYYKAVQTTEIAEFSLNYLPEVFSNFEFDYSNISFNLSLNPYEKCIAPQYFDQTILQCLNPKQTINFKLL